MNPNSLQNEPSQVSVNRREFLGVAATTAAAGAALGTMSTRLASARVLGANDTIRIGIIGVGGRGLWGMKTAIEAGAKCVAVCDVCQQRREQSKQIAEESGSGGTKAYLDHRELLDRDDIDGVFIATPDHWHFDTLIDSLQAGKDVYIEKPLSKSIEEGKRMVQAVRDTKRVVQVGNMRRSGEHWQRAADLIKSGKLGKISWVCVYDMRNWSKGDPFLEQKIEGDIDWERFQGRAKRHEFTWPRFLAWRWYWDYAGGLSTDLGAHHLDVAQWLMDVIGPKSVASHGGNYYFENWETPDVVSNVLDYGSFIVNFSTQLVNGRQGDGATVYGSEGTLICEGSEFKWYAQADNPETPNTNELKEPVETWPAGYEGPAHVKNWLDCMRSRQDPNSPIEIGHRVITAAHLCNISYRTGARVYWDIEKEDFAK